MIAAARIRRLKVDPAIRIVDGGVSVSGTRRSVPFTLAHSCKLVRPSLAHVSHFASTGGLRQYPPSLAFFLFTQANSSRGPPHVPFERVLNFLLDVQSLKVALSCLKSFSEPMAFAASPALRRSTTPLSSPPAALSPPICFASIPLLTSSSAWTRANPALTSPLSLPPASPMRAHPSPLQASSPPPASPASSAKMIFKPALLFPPRTILITTTA